MLLLALLGGCPRGNATVEAEPRVDVEARSGASVPLAFTVIGAQWTRRITTSTLERKDAAAGERFVVLDVGVRNPDAEPQVLLEGQLIGVSESGVQTFDAPVTLFSDDYLSVRVLQPGQSVRGKVAYEVPEDLPGVLYWRPGDGSKRILLQPNTLQDAQRTLADAGGDDTIPTPARVMPAPKQAAVAPTPMPTSRTRSSRDTIATRHAASAGGRAGSVATTTSTKAVTPASKQAASTPDRTTTPDPAVAAFDAMPAAPRTATPTETSSPMDRLVATLMSSSPTGPADASAAAPARSATSGHAPACDDAARASRLVCKDPVLSAMDIQLDQSVERASQHVDALALQRDQARWSGRVRNACATVACLRRVYLRQQARIDALVPAGR